MGNPEKKVGRQDSVGDREREARRRLGPWNRPPRRGRGWRRGVRLSSAIVPPMRRTTEFVVRDGLKWTDIFPAV
jgi:hypothetical protein